MRYLLTPIILCLFVSQTNGQSASYDLPFSVEFQFEEGLYVYFKQWKDNTPIRREQIISLSQPDNPYFFEEILSQPWVSYYNQYNEIQRVKSSKVFGYSMGNAVFTRDHAEIRTIGAICMFTEVRPVTNIERTFASLAFPFPPRNENAKAFIIDFEYNRKLFFNKRNMEEILGRDPLLYRDYRQTKGKWRDKIHQYIALYNERHPIYFPME
ncbi:MAG: hypothetical protein KTR30_18825 [Saprospiraceae bacterium]|nr:hypothetical protein [Saprospiraceae bacterium]